MRVAFDATMKTIKANIYSYALLSCIFGDCKIRHRVHMALSSIAGLYPVKKKRKKKSKIA